MSKKVDWGNTYKPFGTQTMGGVQPKYRSGKEYLQKGLEQQREQEQIQENFQKALPAMEALLKCRMESGSSIKVMRPFHYVSSDLVHTYEQVEDRENGGWMNGDVKYSQFQDVQKSIRPGTELVLKSLDPQMSEFIFEDRDGNEVVLPYTAKQQLMVQTNIYESTIAFMNELGE